MVSFLIVNVSKHDFDSHSRYEGIDGVAFTQYEQYLSDHIVETLVSFSKNSTPSWWPKYRFDDL